MLCKGFLFSLMSVVNLFFHFSRMTTACQQKCIPPTYRDGELSKGESVCLDRCVAKYLEVHESLGKKLTEKSMQDEAMMKQMQQQPSAGQR